MFDIGWSELLVIGIVALIAIGPKELPAVLRTLGQWMTRVRRMAGEFQGQFQEAMREAEMADIKKQVDDIGTAARDMTNFDSYDYSSPKDDATPAPGVTQETAQETAQETTPDGAANMNHELAIDGAAAHADAPDTSLPADAAAAPATPRSAAADARDPASALVSPPAEPLAGGGRAA